MNKKVQTVPFPVWTKWLSGEWSAPTFARISLGLSCKPITAQYLPNYVNLLPLEKLDNFSRNVFGEIVEFQNQQFRLSIMRYQLNPLIALRIDDVWQLYNHLKSNQSQGKNSEYLHWMNCHGTLYKAGVLITK